MVQKTNKMASMPIAPLLLSMSLPLMFSLLVQSLYNIVDSIYVAQISEDALTATSLAYPFQFLMIALSVGIAVGLNALMSRYAGSGNNRKACDIAITGLILSLITAGILSLTGFFFAGTISSAMTSDADISSLTGTYMRICMTFCYGIFLETLAQRMLTSTGLAGLSMVSLIVGAVTNILLDPILIFGKFGLPELGISGAAIATVIGQWLGAAVALTLNRIYNHAIHFIFKGYTFSIDDLKAIFRIGLPTMIMQAVGSLMTGICNSILLSYSSTAVAFFGVYYKLQGFVMMPMNGLGQAVLPITGYNLGMKNKNRIQQLWKISIPAGVAISMIGLLLFLCMPDRLLSLFGASAEMLKIGVPALRIISITFPLAAVSIITGFFCTGLGNSIVNMISASMRQLLVLIPFLYLFAHCFGLQSCWFAFWIAEASACLYSLFCVRRQIKTIVDPLP